jgi:hypothetical protein
MDREGPTFISPMNPIAPLEKFGHLISRSRNFLPHDWIIRVQSMQTNFLVQNRSNNDHFLQGVELMLIIGSKRPADLSDGENKSED